MSEVQSKSKIRILLITDLYPIDDNDKTIPLAIENFTLALKEFDIETEVIRPNFILNALIRKHKIYKQDVFYRNDIKIYNRNFLLPFIYDNFKPSNNFDLIISHMPSGNIYADLLNQKLKLPRISIVHQSDYTVLTDFKYSFYFRKKLKKALKNSSIIGARNSTLAQKLKTNFILPSFVDKKFVLSQKTPKEKLKIITISKLIKRKNILMVLKALSSLNQDFEYEIYGEGKEKKRLTKFIKQYNLEYKVKLKGQIEHNLIWEKLDSSDIFILPSERETFGLCYLEAMARGLVTISKKSESMDNIITNGVNGFLVESSDEICDILKSLDLNKKQEIMNNTLMNIKNYQKEVIISNYIAIIKKILNNA